ncbi:7-carboxy-7-deazaguanine synthase [Paenibacillus sp. FSL R7-0273]|uniref:7-carboxy-7-deazaguanine synthase QueE n=1 Tax=Paenibacillus sp. FSL R7-0273 TaxID=1536772 RepID=UPI0004F78E72|nr:7-carboxy-7-deazaguanine synthase QueE [Paenibacillus sp. FSL R7-0273]AIQ47506.1 7-carboxy-7-deazaguanine synthase [Paenibacillus sp. FSL R7-0273]OMF95935.1 7-carboxy-7-deazaguanine synthase QueE [Paenibacillus sp. FSL R7-0273]
MSKIPVIEIFGPTIQGEGAVIGVKTMFVRTYGCDYRCGWCDSAFTWDGSAKDKVQLMEPEAILAELLALAGDNFDCVTISGGNPALIGEGMAAFVKLLHERGIQAAIETQGSRWQDWFYDIDVLTISPKPPSSGMPTDWGKLDDIIDKLQQAGKAAHSLKVVVFNEEDFAYAREVHRRYPEIPMFLQPGNEDVTEPGDISARLLGRLEWLFNLVIGDPAMNRVRVLPQLHALIWHNKRGK